MTKIITRYFETAKQARAVKFELVHRQRISIRIMDLYDSADGLVDALTEQHVEKATAQEYEKRVKNGGAVLLVRAGIKPLSVARNTRLITEAMGAVDIGDFVEEVFVKDERRYQFRLLTDHRRFLTRPRDPDYDAYHMADWPIGLISRRKPFRGSVFRPNAYMASWPIKHILPGHKHQAGFPFGHLVPGHKFQANWPIGHLIPGHKHQAGFPFGHIVPGHKFQAKFPFDHLVPGHKFMANWPIGHLIPGHIRMARWPFPLLMNGKQRLNSLVPKGARMANFPFGLLVPGQKFQAKFPFDHLVPGHKFMANWPFGHLIPGHKHQANFPIPLISKRKPKDNFAFPRHARMADVILPLVIRR